MMPRLLTIDGQRVKIRRVTLGRMPQGYRWGGEYQANEIRIGSGMTRNGERAVLLHELMHHLLERADARLPRKQEEFVLDCLDSWLLLAMRENPELVAFLMEDE